MDEQDKRQERQSLIKRVLAFVAALALCATLVGSQASVQTWKRPVNALVSHYQHLVIASGETQTPLNVDDVLGDLPDVGIEVHMPPGEHRATVIYIPGLAQGPGANFVRGTLSSRWPNVKWTTFIPPLRHVDVWHREHGELQSNAWFDMKSFPYDYAHDHDTKSFAESAVQIHRVIKKEIDELVRSMRSLQDEPVNNDEITAEERQAAAKRIALGGFSQGAAMTLLAGLTLDYELGGLFPLSGFLPLRRAIPFMVKGNKKDMPVHMAHGDGDRILTLADAERSRDILLHQVGLRNMTFDIIEGVPHWFNREEVERVGEWLRDTVFPPDVTAGTAKKNKRDFVKLPKALRCLPENGFFA